MRQGGSEDAIVSKDQTNVWHWLNIQYHVHSVYPLLKIVAGHQRGSDLSRFHVFVLGHIFGILPLKELEALRCSVWFTPKVAVGSSLLVLWLPEGQNYCNGTRAAIKLHFDDVGDVICCELALLGAVSLHKKGQGLGNANGIRELHKRTLAKTTFDDRLSHQAADIGCRTVNFCRILAAECATTMCTPSAICVDDDLTAGEASITLGSSNDELA
mmetsp:Transcript_76468/g.145523  ORF Transcript_76468/g.145523 Transcript_76468/m.145523 type:complete len:214 (+) Transcript_76468:74-715(+)